jgi:UDP-N-acetylmuramoyl-tripeptide--D-alanyl-D-alanine ligase
MELRQLHELYSRSFKVTTDSRNISEGCLYFALKGEKFDGNEFARQALETGASFAIIDNKAYYLDERTILVRNVLETLQDLAHYHRKQLHIPVIGITGTNGKTTTKELMNAVLSSKFRVLATKGNLNNHIGVPLTLLSITREIEIAIIEMGANHPNEIDFLCRIAEPDHAVITNVGKAHLEGFGGFEGVKKTKKELYDYVVEKKGIVFINSDDVVLSSMLSSASETNPSVKKISYGFDTGEVIRGIIVSGDPFVNVEVVDQRNGEKEVVNSQLVGEYNAENIVTAVCTGVHFGISLREIASAISNYQPSNNRSQLIVTKKNKVILDCYNANPSSTLASLNNFDKMKAERRTVILGDMLELGEEAETEHKQIIQHLKKMSGVNVLLVGEWYQKLSETFSVTAFKSADELKAWLKIHPIENSLLLVKGSRGIQLEKIVEEL